MRLEQAGVEQIDDAEAVAGHLAFIGGADAAAGGTDFSTAGGAFGGELDHAVVFEDDLGAISGDEDLLVDVDAEVAQLADFAQEGYGIEDDTVADDGFVRGGAVRMPQGMSWRT